MIAEEQIEQKISWHRLTFIEFFLLPPRFQKSINDTFIGSLMFTHRASDAVAKIVINFINFETNIK